MLLNITFVKRKSIKSFLEHALYLAILFILIPVFLFFEHIIVLPTIAEKWSWTYIMHTICTAFLLLNVVGNMIFGMLTSSSIRGKLLDSNTRENWSFCSVCECLRPPRSWHCDTCNICILKRDHHCPYFASCIGYFNQRYFIHFVLHIFVSMVYAFYYNVQFLAAFISWNHGLVIIKFIFPLASIVFDFGYETVYIILIIINALVALFTGFLLFYHLNNILQGKTTPENKKSKIKSPYHKNWKENLKEVFGARWYLTWISPFIKSPLPGDGVSWDVDIKNN